MSIPQHIGKYQVISQVGMGPSASVYRCWDELAREVALKIVSKADSQGVQKLLQESRILKLLDTGENRGIPRIYQRFETEECFGFSMEYISGKSLKEAAQSLKADEAVCIAIAISETLHFVHERGILFLDINPSNILLRPNKTPVLIDYGTSLTRPQFKARLKPGGTPGFLAPEVEQGEMKEFDTRIDVYGLGATLGYMLAKGSTKTTNAVKLAYEKAMSERSDDRYQTAREFAEALRIANSAGHSVSRFVRRFQELAKWIKNILERRGNQAIQSSIEPNTWLTSDPSEWLGDAIECLLNAQESDDAKTKGRELSRCKTALISVLESYKSVDLSANDGMVHARLWNMFRGLYATDHMEILIGWISVNASDDEWWELVPTMLIEDDYVVRHAVASGQARRLLKGLDLQEQEKVDAAKSEVVGLLKGIAPCGSARGVNIQEMGCYVVGELGREIEGNELPSWFEMNWLETMLGIPLYFARSALNDLLISWCFTCAARVQEFIQKNQKKWPVIWQHLQIDLDDIDALLPPKGKESPEVKANRRFRSSAEFLGKELQPKLTGYPRIQKTISHYLQGDVALDDPELVPELELLFKDEFNVELACGLSEFLMSHPLWTKAEEFAGRLATLAEKSSCSANVFSVVDELVEHENWKVQYGAIEAAFLFREVDDQAIDGEGTRFDSFVSRYHDHPVRRIRGLCSEDFVGDLLEQRPDRWISRLNGRFSDSVTVEEVVTRLLNNDDAWVVDHLHRLLHFVYSAAFEQQFAKEFLEIRKRFDDLLKGLKSEELLGWIKPFERVAGRSMNWYQMERGTFLEKLEEAKRELIEATKKPKRGMKKGE